MRITKSHPNFTRLYFACLAVSKDDAKPTLNNILVEESRIIGCDGYRVHITEGEVYPNNWDIDWKIEPGQYFPTKVTKSQIILDLVADAGNYPDIDAVFPDIAEMETIKLLNVDGRKDTDIDQNYVRLVRLGVGRCFNHKYVVEMLTGANFDTAYLDQASSDRAIVFKGECDNAPATGLLMPIRMND